MGVGRSAITNLARDYEIQLRDPVHRRRVTVDRGWLYDQYSIERRALPEIAKEVGVSTSSLARLAKIYAIPMRGRGGPSHSATLATQNVIADAPEVLKPALAGIGGSERLRRFEAAAQHPTLAVAARALGVNQFTLVNQINRIERELGTKLLDRAERGHPMKLTKDGAQVVADVRACQHKGW
ncbi:LysR family transcriptional regulator [Mycobacteroides sp. PCS013]|uniref:LysR family transcriptional regulator n=1 Tax=Mycobacteroides sp. PCS013 TaxID=3074106 RepID=UPI003C2FC79A